MTDDSHGGSGLPAADDDRLARLAELLGSSPHNLVSRGDRALLRTVHIPEALAVAGLLPVAGGQRWMDLGTGGGLPGLVLAIAFPEVEWVLLDSTRKKVEAVRGFAEELGLGNVTAIAERAEAAGRQHGLRGRFDGVVARAVAPLQVLAELARGFPRSGGCLVAIKGPAWEEELRRAQAALGMLRWSLSTTEPVASAARPTWLVTLRADGAPPPRFPRRAGLPKREPLGGPGRAGG